MSEPTWLTGAMVDAMHADLIRAFGGSPGVRDAGLIESALARPRNRWAYEPDTGLAELAAAYGFGLARNHGYVDGNKRIAFAAVGVFLMLNGQRLTASQEEAYAVMIDLASGELGEAEFALWLRASVEPLPGG